MSKTAFRSSRSEVLPPIPHTSTRALSRQSSASPQNTPLQEHLYRTACVFLFQTDYLNNSTKHKLCTLFLQILHGQFLGFHLLVSFLKMLNEVMFVSSSRIKFQMIGPKYLIEFDPFSTALICGITKSDFERR